MLSRFYDPRQINGTDNRLLARLVFLLGIEAAAEFGREVCSSIFDDFVEFLLAFEDFEEPPDLERMG
uniref:Uncharacterized protein n=1 Tax=Pristionchus pacificus TaxID=54126 RepID=A0A2A6C6D2_PRIPA|eukprot:PDM73581.1 hypothetical protein PRIPAC_40937 [Pristionchus pacificus]